MPLNLVAKAFQEAMLPALVVLNCGDTPWGRWATDWILCRSDYCARTSIARGTQVVVFYLDDQLAGFGSLGPTPRNVHKVRPLGMIPQLGLDIRFQHYPPDSEWPDRVSTAIVLHLLALAREQRYNGVVLQVHIDNRGARKLYDRIGFVPYKDPDDKNYQLMVVKL